MTDQPQVPDPRGLGPEAGHAQAGPQRLAEVRFGVALPQSAENGEHPAARIKRFARAAERLGFDGLWTLDTVRGRSAVLEPLVALTAAAMATSRIRLGVAVVILPLRAPVELARTSASLDRLSGGRLELGVGLGSDPERVRSVGIDPARRVARLLDGVEVIRALWTGEPATVEGRTLAIRNWRTRPTPIQRPSPRIWFGGHHPDALRRAVTLGDGWIGAGSTARDDFADEITIVREHLARLRRDESAFGLGKRLYLGIENRRGSTKAEVRRWFGDHYGDEGMADRVAVVGPPSAVVEAVLDIVGLGAGLVILHPVTDEERSLRQLAGEVIPAVREALRARSVTTDAGRRGAQAAGRAITQVRE